MKPMKFAPAVALFAASVAGCMQQKLVKETEVPQAQTNEFSQKLTEWDNFRKNYKADYSDGSQYLLPPKTGRFATPLPIVKDGKPMAEIHYNESESEACVGVAAKELQYFIKEITGATIPINQSLRQPGVTQIMLGKRVGEFIVEPNFFQG